MCCVPSSVSATNHKQFFLLLEPTLGLRLMYSASGQLVKAYWRWYE